MRALVAASLLWAWDVSAETSVRLEMSVDLPPCLVESDVRARVVETLGRDPFAPEAATAVSVDRDGPDLRVALRRDGGVEGERTLRAPDCRELARRLALVLAISIAGLRDGPARRAPVTEPERRSELEPAPEPELTPHAAVPTFAFDGLAGLAGGYGSESRWIAALVFGGRFRARRLSIGLEVRLEPPAATSVPGGGQIVTSSMVASLIPCAAAGSASVCALLSAGWIRGRGEGLEDARTAMTPHASAGGRLGLEHWLLPSLALRAHVEGERALTETILRVDEMPAWTSAVFEVRVGLSLLAQIP